MKIAGIQKNSLLDYPGKICATVFTGGCNLRCPFCHNASLVLGGKRAPFLSDEELFFFLEKRKGLLDGVCVTGGEPLLQKGIKEFIAEVKKMGYLVKLDTNGFFPEELEFLLEEGKIDYVAMDIKNSPENYEKTVGVKDADISKVMKSGELLMEGKVPYEFRTTVVEGFHEKEDFISIGKWLAGAGQYFLQNFQDSGDVIVNGLQPVSKEKLYEFQKILTPYMEKVEIRGI